MEFNQLHEFLHWCGERLIVRHDYWASFLSENTVASSFQFHRLASESISGLAVWRFGFTSRLLRPRSYLSGSRWGAKV